MCYLLKKGEEFQKFLAFFVKYSLFADRRDLGYGIVGAFRCMYFTLKSRNQKLFCAVLIVQQVRQISYTYYVNRLVNVSNCLQKFHARLYMNTKKDADLTVMPRQ